MHHTGRMHILEAALWRIESGEGDSDREKTHENLVQKILNKLLLQRPRGE